MSSGRANVVVVVVVGVGVVVLAEEKKINDDEMAKWETTGARTNAAGSENCNKPG